MKRTMRLVHPIAGTIALLTILVFWTSSLAVKISGSVPAIVAVKTAIPWGLLLLVPALAVTGASGSRLGRGRSDRRVSTKRRRMPFIAANGLLVLIPCALYLAWKAQSGTLDAAFHTVQVVELVAGASNLVLMALNLRDGWALTHRREGGRRTATGVVAR